MRGLWGILFYVAVAAAPAYAAAYDDFSRGEVAVRGGNADGAIDFFSKALAAGDLAPTYLPNAHVGRARAYMAKKQYRNALDDLNAALQLKPDDVEARLLRIGANLWLNKTGEVTADYREVVRLRPTADMHAVFASTEWHLGAFAVAAENFAIAADRYAADSTSRPYAVLWYAISAERIGKLDQAVLAKHLSDIDEGNWPAPLLQLFLGKLGEDVVLAKTKNKDPVTQTNRQCEAEFFLGEWHLARGDSSVARTLLGQAIGQCAHDFEEYRGAQEEMQRLPK